MNWSKVKTVLIVFFLCTNIFLLHMLWITSGQTKEISEEILVSTAEILKKNGIQIRAEKIPKKNEQLPEYSYRLAAEDSEWTARFLGGSAEKNGENRYLGKFGELSVQEEGFVFLGSIPLSGLGTNPIDAVLRALRRRGIEAESAELTEEDKISVIEVVQCVRHIPIPEARLRVVLSEEAITEISGVWYQLQKETERAAQKSAESVLMDFVSEEGRPKEAEIDSFEQCYIGGETLYPAWRILLTDGKEYWLDGRDT